MKTCEKLAVKLVDIRTIRVAYLMFCLPRNTRMPPKGKTVNIAIDLYYIILYTLVNSFENTYKKCGAGLQPGTFSPVVSFSRIFSIH